VTPKLKNVTALCASVNAYAALVDDSVVCWGEKGTSDFVVCLFFF